MAVSELSVIEVLENEGQNIKMTNGLAHSIFPFAS